MLSENLHKFSGMNENCLSANLEKKFGDLTGMYYTVSGEVILSNPIK